MSALVHELIAATADRTPAAPALLHGGNTTSFASLAALIEGAASGLRGVGVERQQRVAVLLPKRVDSVCALFGTTVAGGVMVPLDPLLGDQQVLEVLHHCDARVLVTSPERLHRLAGGLAAGTALNSVIVCGGAPVQCPGLRVYRWSECTSGRHDHFPAGIDTDTAAELYTWNSCGKPASTLLSHRALVARTRSLARYLGDTRHQRLLSLFPPSSDYGLSLLTMALAGGAATVLTNYLCASDIHRVVQHERINGLAAGPALWSELAAVDWDGAGALNFINCFGGPMPEGTLNLLRRALPHARIILAYGPPDALRPTCLAPGQPSAITRTTANAAGLTLQLRNREYRPGEVMLRCRGQQAGANRAGADRFAEAVFEVIA